MRLILERIRVLIIMVISVFILAACDTDPDETIDAITIVFEAEGIDSIEVTELDDLEAPEAPTKEGHTFTGWYLDQAFTESFAFDALPETDITLYPHFEPDPFEISFANTDHEAITVLYGEPIPEIDDPEATADEIFTGWYLDQDLTTAFTQETMPADNLTLYAAYSETEVLIEIEAEGFADLSALPGDPFPAIDDPAAPDHHTFAGWYLDEDFDTPLDLDTVPEESINLYPRFEAIAYTITFENTDLDAQTIPGGTTVDLPDAEASAGETFVGWFFDADFTESAGDSLVIDEDITLFALFETATYTLSFANTGDFDIPDATYQYGETINLDRDMMKTGHYFDGWYLDEDYATPLDMTTMPDHDLTLYARWIAQTYTITFETFGGEDLADIEMTYGEELELPIPEAPEDKAFDGWYLDQDFTTPFDFDTMPDHHLNLYANFAPITYTVAFETFDGEPLSSLQAEGGTTFDLPVDVAHDDKVFMGWYLDTDFTEPAGETITVEDDITLYARLIDEESYTITFETFGGTELADLELTTGETLPAEHIPEREHATFAAWYLDEDRTIHFPFDTPITEDLTLYAAYGTAGLLFTLNDDEESYTVTIGTADRENIIIPARHQDKPVTIIGQEGFSEQDLIKGIILPKTLETIEMWAFFEAEALESIHIPERVSEIGMEAFMNAYNLVTVTFAEDIELEKLYWHLFFNAHALENIEIPRSVTDIYPGVFYHNTSLQSIHIPNTIEYIGDYAFFWNTSLETVTFEEDSNLETIAWEAFAGQNKLTEIFIPKSVVYIEGHAYADLSQVESIIFEADSALKHIGSGAFADIDNVTAITLPDTVETIGWGTFRDMDALETIDLGTSLISIGSFAFNGSANLSSITFPQTLEEIGGSSFAGTSIFSIHIPENVTALGLYAFGDNENLTTVTFAENIQLEAIHSRTFEYTALQELTIPASVTSFSAGALVGIETLQALHVQEGNEHYSSINGVLFNADETELLIYPSNSPLTHYEVPLSVTKIGGIGFSNNKHLITVSLPPNLETIGHASFRNAESLTSIGIPGSLTEMGDRVFEGASNLETVTFGPGIDIDEIGEHAFEGTAIDEIDIPESVRWIRWRAFANTPNLMTIYVNRWEDPGITNIHYTSFSGLSGSASIFIPSGSFDAYSNAMDWEDYSGQMLEDD